MCIPDIDGDGDPDTCVLCLPIMCILGYCCCKKCRNKNEDRSNNGYVPPGGVYAPPGSYPAYPAGAQFPFYTSYPSNAYFADGYGQMPGQPGMFAGYPGQQPFYAQPPIFPSQPNFTNQPSFGQSNQQNGTSHQSNQNEFKQQPGSAIVSYVQ